MVGLGYTPVKFTTYFHTIRYLRPVQLYGRLWFRWYRPAPRRGLPPPIRPRTGSWCAPTRRLPSLYAPTGFCVLNEARALRSTEDWNHSAWDKLWLYNLHYFDDLNARDGAKRKGWHRALIRRWIAENPVGAGNGWEPYPLSLRLVNWIKWTLAGNDLEPEWVQSLAVQAHWLRRRLEWHLLGNHLLANAKALIFAGLFFGGKEAEGWLAKGLKILTRQVPEQVLSDGGHFERSPMYHAIILEDLLDLLNLAHAYPGVIPKDALERGQEAVNCMLAWLNAMCHPDEEIGFFNDAALGVAPMPAEIFAYAERLGCVKRQSGSLTPLHPEVSQASSLRENGRYQWLQESGYIRLQHGQAVAILDVAPIGPDYLPGHAHADTLSFELSIFGQRVLVNSGTSCYGISPERLRQRATAAHNTVVVDSDNSSEVWGGFRVARRARPLELNLEQEDNLIRVRCGHDGYQRLSGKPIHWREWALGKKALTIHDNVQGRYHQAIAYFHFHPAVKLMANPGEKCGSARLPDGNIIRWDVPRGSALLKPSSYHPRFGASEASQCLEVSLEGAESRVSFYW